MTLAAHPGVLKLYARRAGMLVSPEERVVPVLDLSTLPVKQRLPGWRGRYFHSPNMTFAHYEFERGASIHEHYHPEEEVYVLLEGELELTIDGVPHIAKPGMVAIVPSNARHSVMALTDGSAMIVDHPRRPEFE